MFFFFSPSFNVRSPPSRDLSSLYVRWEDEYRKTDLCHGSKLTVLSMLERPNPHVILHVVWAHLTTADYCKGMRGLKSQSANISWGMRMRALRGMKVVDVGWIKESFRPMAEVSFRLLVSLANVKRKETSDSKENTKHKKYD